MFPRIGSGLGPGVSGNPEVLTQPLVFHTKTAVTVRILSAKSGCATKAVRVMTINGGPE